MEIGSTSSMASMMSMQSNSAPPPPPEGDTSEASADFISALDSDGDGSLSETEFAAGGSGDSSESTEIFDALDTNEDGVVTQDEIEADMKSKQAAMQAEMESGGISGIQQTTDTEQFQQLMSLMDDSSSESQSQGADKYSQMQESMFGGGSYDSMSLSGSLSVTA